MRTVQAAGPQPSVKGLQDFARGRAALAKVRDPELARSTVSDLQVRVIAAFTARPTARPTVDCRCGCRYLRDQLEEGHPVAVPAVRPLDA